MNSKGLRVTLVLVLFVLLSCSQSVRQTSSNLNTWINNEDTTVYTEHNVYLSPQQPIQFPGTNLSFNQILDKNVRSLSYNSSDLTKEASSNDVAFPIQNALVENTDMKFNPNWVPDAPKPSDIAYCMYTFNLLGYDKEPTVELVWTQKPTSWYSLINGKSNVWIALGNSVKHSWEWFDVHENSIVTLNSLNPYIGTSGKMYVAVVILGRSASILDKIKIGTLETVVTGLEYILPTPENEPDLYLSGSLPTLFDLSTQMNSPRMQMPWGSAPAFAIGDGAFNMVLAQIYKKYGWNPENTFNQISPKYLYLESGNHLCGPNQGRDINDILLGMQTIFGASSELNAPYETTSCDRNWTLASKTDAGSLKIDDYKFLSFSGTNVISKFKQLLTYKIPIIIGLKIDNGFFKYKTGEVWNYSGPEAAYHALCIVGWDDTLNAFKVRNSWGPTWGDYGHVWINFDTFKNNSAGVYAAILLDQYSPEVALRFCSKTDNLAPPTNLKASKGKSEYYTELSWIKAVGVDGYRIYRDDQTNLVATVGDVSSWDDSTITDDKTHTYWIKSTQGANVSDYSIPAWGWLMSGGSKGSESEPNDYHSNANILPAVPIAGIKGNVSDTDTVDSFSLEAVDKAVYVFTLNYDNSTGNAGLKLFDKDGTLWQLNNNGNTGEKVIIQGLQKGTYYLDVTYLSKYTDYLLSVTAYEPGFNETENNDDISEATMIVLPVTNFHGSIGLQGYDGDNYDYLGFSVFEGQYIKARLKYNTTEGNLYFKLLDSAGNTISSDTNANPGERLINIGLKKGNYYFYVYPAADANVEYFLTCSLENPGYDEIEDNDTISTGNVLPAFPVSNYFGHVGRESYDGGTTKTDLSDFYVFSLTEEKTISVELSYDNSTGSNLYLYITDSKGSNIVSDSSGSITPRKCTKKLSAGNYGIKVYAGALGAQYHFNVTAD